MDVLIHSRGRYILPPMRIILRVLLAAIAVNIAVGILAASATAGAQQDCAKAEQQVIQGAGPKNWASLHLLFRRFGDCDDGAIGEGFSEDVAQLLSRQWSHLDALSRLTASDKAFERFVLRHIDATLSDDDLKVIANNSRLHCPTGEKRFCKLVQAKAQSSLDELRTNSK